MSGRSLFAVFVLVGLMGIAILGLLGRQGELRDRVGELEQALRDARRPKATAKVSLPEPAASTRVAPEARALREENDRLHKEVADLKERIVARKVEKASDLLAKFDGGQTVDLQVNDFPSVGGDLQVVHTGFTAEDSLDLTDVQRARVAVLEKRRDEELAVFDAAGPADDPNRRAFRKEIEDRWGLAIKQDLDPAQQAKYDAIRGGGGRLSDVAGSEKLVWRTLTSMGDATFYYRMESRPLVER